MTTDEFISVRRALVESQAKIQELVQVKSDLEKYLSEMHNKVRPVIRKSPMDTWCHRHLMKVSLFGAA